MNNKILLTLFLLLGSVSLFAQQSNGSKTHIFNLQQCIDYAYENQDSVKNAKLDIENANYRVREIIGSGLPQISGSANFQDYLKTPTILFPDLSAITYQVLEKEKVNNGSGQAITAPIPALQPFSFTQKYQSNVGLSVNQLLFDGSYIVGLQASKTFKDLAQRNYTRSRISTNVNVTKAYYQVLVSDEQIKLLDANIKQLSQQLNEVTQMNKQGFVEKIDVDRLTVLQNNLLTNRINVSRLLTLGKQLLKFQMGMPITDSLAITEKIVDVKLDQNAITLITDTTSYKNRVEYGLLELQKRYNEFDLKRYKSMYLPSLAAFGSSSYQYQNNSFSKLFDQKFPTTLVGLQLNVPIYSGGQKASRVSQAKIAVQKSDNILHAAKNGINLQIENARIMYANGLESLNNQKQNRDLANEVLRVSRIKYEQGVGSNIEVTQAQTALQEADNNYIQALYNALISKVDLETAFGNIK